MTKVILEVNLPDEIYTKIEQVIIETLNREIKKIQESPKKLTREETAKHLKISLPTLRQREIEGILVPERSGKRVLYDQRTIEQYLKNTSAYTT